MIMSANPSARIAYDILGLPRDANAAAVRDAYRKAAMRYHPDLAEEGRRAEAQSQFTRINQAFEVLQDADTRRRYDRLLEQNHIPDLEHDLPEHPPQRSLFEILREISSLDLNTNPNELLAGMDRHLLEMLLPQLFSDGHSYTEPVLDALRFHRLVAFAGFQSAPGNLTEGWLIITELRVIVLMKYTHEYKRGDTKHTDLHFRFLGFLFGSMKVLRLEMIGRARVVHRLEIENEQGLRIHVDFKAPHVPRLLLVAGAYRLPLRVRARASRRRETIVALLTGLAPVLAWCALYLATAAHDLQKHGWIHKPDYRLYSQWLNQHHLTTAAIYLTGALLVWSWWRLDRAWVGAGVEEVLGPLPVDYALGRDAATQAREGGGPLQSTPPSDDLAVRWLLDKLAASGPAPGAAVTAPPKPVH